MSDGDNKNDLTRIEDLSEFLHQGDDELDKVLAEIDSEDEAGDEEDVTEVELSSFDYDTPESPLDFEDSQNDSQESFDENTQSSFDDNFEDDNSFEDDMELEDEASFDNFDNMESDEDDQFEDQFDNQFEEDEGEIELSGPNIDGPEDSLEDDFENNFESNFEDDFQEDNLEELEAQNEIQGELEGEIDGRPEEGFEEELEGEFEGELEDVEVQNSPQITPDIEQPQAQATTYDDFELPESLEEEAPLPDLSNSTKEDFSEVRDFAQNSTYGKVAIGGNPPFSLLLQGVNGEEFTESILATLNEFGLLEGNEDLYRKSLESGQLLIAQISEFSAIVLAGKLRRYCRNIKVALAHEIHKSDSYDHTDQRGLTGPRSIAQNRSKQFQRKNFNKEDIVLSTSPFIPGFKIVHSLGPMQINEQIDRSEFNDFSSINLVDYFEEKIQDMAFKKGANAVTSIHFNIGLKEIDGVNYNIIMAHGDFVYLEPNK